MPLLSTFGAASARSFGGIGAVAAGAGLDIDEAFSTYLYDGTGSAQTITNGIDLSGEGGLVWTKSRNNAALDHYITDSEIGDDYYLSSNTTGAAIGSFGDTRLNFTGTGYDLGANSGTNSNGDTFVSWTFRKAPKFFDVVTYTGTGSAQNISHNLASVPGMIITKRTSGNSGWGVYHRSKGATAIGTLNATSGWITDTSFYNNTEPTSTHFTVGSAAYTGQNTETYVAYLFAHNNNDGEFGPDGDQDIIKCGSYTGTASSGNFVSLGFEPQWLLIKRSSGTEDWMLFDNMRGVATGGTDQDLRPNKSNAEGSTQDWLDFNATGFTLNTTLVNVNGSGSTYIYMAIRRGPLALPTDATKVFAVDTLDSTAPGFDSNFVVDMAFERNVSSASDTRLGTRLLGTSTLRTNTTEAVSTQSSNVWDYMDGWFYDGSSNSSKYSWMWKRALGYFDVVAYTGTGSNRTVSHNLGAVPEMMWVKVRSTTDYFQVYHKDLAATEYLEFRTNAKTSSNGTRRWNSTRPTDSVFSLGDHGSVNGSGQTYIAYLFATVAGVSKVGSYTGNGSANHQIDCGFSSGARFVLIKRTDSSDGWKVHDSVRGIVAGNDPFVELNNTNVENSSFDLLDPYSGGFAVNNYAGWNASGGSYIFYAIA